MYEVNEENFPRVRLRFPDPPKDPTFKPQSVRAWTLYGVGALALVACALICVAIATPY